jgi:hypothetical protein
LNPVCRNKMPASISCAAMAPAAGTPRRRIF